MHRFARLLALAFVVLVVAAPAAGACGSLIAPNGAVNLVRTTTLAAYHDGVEHYVTSFEFAGSPQTFGSIIPLPAEPTAVERAGGWTLQRLEREVQPPPLLGEERALAAASANDAVDVLRQVRIDSLDVTILRGGGKAVAQWAAEQGFDLSADAPAVLDFYARRSPYFMAAKFDATAAVAQGLSGGDGIPVHLAIPTRDPWVPLRILGTGKPGDAPVNADVFLLTDQRPALLHGAGFDVVRSAQASTGLLDDLRSDANSEWVPGAAWLTYGRVDARADELQYDLAIDPHGGTPRLRDTGATNLGALVLDAVPTGPPSPAWTIGAITAAIGVLALTAFTVRRLER